MRDLEHEIVMKLVINKDMSMSEIQADFPEISGRTIIRKVKELERLGKIEHTKIPRKGKRQRYFIKEENTKENLTVRALNDELIEQKIYESVRATVTQRQLSSLISEEIKFYKKEFVKIKDTPDKSYYLYHLSMIGHCLEWNTKLTFAINSGMLGESPNKLNLARRNKDRYEEFLQKLIFNIKRHDEKLGQKILKQIYNKLEDMWLLEKINPN